jgi:fibronectin type 3 domain-containing protein
VGPQSRKYNGKSLVKRFICVVSAILLLSLIACGKKAPPLPRGARVPAPVGDFKGEVKDGVLFLSFVMPASNLDGTGIEGLAGFKILKSCSGCEGRLERWREIRLTDTAGFTVFQNRIYLYDDDLTQGQDYSYQVIAFTEKEVNGAPSGVYSIKWEKTPRPPKEVRAEGEDRRIELSWSKEDGVFYNVYRFEGDVYPLAPVNSLLLTNTFFTDRELENGKRYTYEVRSVRLVGTMRWEGSGTAVVAEARDKTPPPAPRGAQGEKKEKGVSITWEKSAESDLLGYNIYRVGTGKAEKLNKEPIQETSFLDTEPGSGRYVSYYVTAVDTSGNESGPSRELIITLRE